MLLVEAVTADGKETTSIYVKTASFLQAANINTAAKVINNLFGIAFINSFLLKTVISDSFFINNQDFALKSY